METQPYFHPCLHSTTFWAKYFWLELTTMEVLVFILACRPKAAFLFWFFGGFKCGVWLFIVLPVGHKNRK